MLELSGCLDANCFLGTGDACRRNVAFGRLGWRDRGGGTVVRREGLLVVFLRRYASQRHPWWACFGRLDQPSALPCRSPTDSKRVARGLPSGQAFSLIGGSTFS